MGVISSDWPAMPQQEDTIHAANVNDEEKQLAPQRSVRVQERKALETAAGTVNAIFTQPPPPPTQEEGKKGGKAARSHTSAHHCQREKKKRRKGVAAVTNLQPRSGASSSSSQGTAKNTHQPVCLLPAGRTATGTFSLRKTEASS
jgi:hypothetical protein